MFVKWGAIGDVQIWGERSLRCILTRKVGTELENQFVARASTTLFIYAVSPAISTCRSIRWMILAATQVATITLGFHACAPCCKGLQA